MEQITEELLLTIKFIPIEERQSKWYEEYLGNIHTDLIKENNNQTTST